MADHTEALREAISTAIKDMYKIGGIPRLFVNAELPGVIVPDHVRNRFGTKMPIDLRPEYPMDLEHTTEALEATLSFGTLTVRCVFPWRSIFAVADAHTGVGIVIEMNVPPQKPRLVVPRPEPRPAEHSEQEIAETKQSTKNRFGLRLVKGGKA